MLGTLLQPLAHLLLDDSGVDSVPAFIQLLFGNLGDQVVIPLASTTTAHRTFRQSTPQDLQRPVNESRCGSMPFSAWASCISTRMMKCPSIQPCQLLHHAPGCLTPQHRTLSLMSLQFINDHFLLPPFMVKDDQGRGRDPACRQAASSATDGAPPSQDDRDRRMCTR